MKQSFARIAAQLALKTSGCIFLILALNNWAFAKGGEVGNGGDVFQCQNSKSVLVDIYEAQAERGIKLDLGGPRLALFAKVDMALKRLERLSPLRAKMYREQAHNFFNEASLIPGAQLTPIQDVYNWATPDGCELKQIAVQHVPQFPQDKRYLVSKNLWDTLDDDSKAALILHEVIYREAIDLGFTNSISVRYFNSLIFSHELDKATPKDFVQTLLAIPFKDYEVNGVRFQITNSSQVYFYENGNVQYAPGPAWDPALQKSINCPNKPSDCSLYFDQSGNLKSALSASLDFGHLTVSGSLQFGANGKLNAVEAARLIRSDGNQIDNYDYSVKDLDASNFDENGNITHVDWVVDMYSGEPGYINFVNGVLSRPMTTVQQPIRINFASDGWIQGFHSDTPVEFYLKPGMVNSVGPGPASPYNELWTSDLQVTAIDYLTTVPRLDQDFFLTYGLTDPSTGKVLGIDFKAGTSLSFQTMPSAMIVDTGTLGKDVALPVDYNGKTQVFPAGTVVHFDSSGVVTTSSSR